MLRYLFLALLILPLSACLPDKADQAKSEKVTIVTIDGTVHVFDVELALTPEEQSIGLMNRESMDDDKGMLFYFGGEEDERAFWMKNTLIPLDLIFIRADGRIHHIHENSIPGDLTTMKSQGPVAAVLEINGGLSAKMELFPDDRVIHRFFEENNVE